jgi:ADP-L-glycero-D-manno-heptose 6-epimerase
MHDMQPLPQEQIVAEGLLRYVPIPESLVGKYQCHTQADLGALRGIGCDIEFADVATGIERYMRWLGEQARDSVS